MKTLTARFAMSAAAVLAGVAHGGDLEASRHHKQTDYRVFNLSSNGGTLSQGNSINDLGMVTGFSNFPGDQTAHATLWLYGLKVDLGTLGGPERNSNVPWPVKNNRGLIVGISQTDTPQPLGETWSCRAFFPFPTRAGYTCLGFAWERGKMRALPTLGGDNGFATGANNRGQIVGWAENKVHDPTCRLPQVLQFRAVIWGPGKKKIQELPPFGDDDTTTAATAINDKGQVVGISGACGTAVGGVSARYSVIWENGRVKEIGDLGGVAWNTPMAINQRGDVVGFSNYNPDDGEAFNAHAFIWTKSGGVRPIRPFEGHAYSQAFGINERRQVVGQSCNTDFSMCRPFLWEDSVMKDLNDLVAPGYGDLLISAQDINDQGKVTGLALVQDTQEQVAFVAIPVRQHHGHDSKAAPSNARTGVASTRSVVLPGNVRQGILDRLGVTGADLDR